MKKFLIVVDMQNDFVDGALGTKEAESIVDNVVCEIENFNGKIFATYDTHYEDYLQTSEGKKLPVEHCIKDTDGWQLNSAVEEALNKKGFISVIKNTFGSVDLPKLIKEEAGNDDFSVELIGLCTDICVVSNALLLKANFSEKDICVKENCCAGVTPDAHNCALVTMRSCQIDII
ncbi:MAG: cysteine hydrolase [Eubacterium sp.]|nr:cysteine hydrolase [Eubacterium sp.]